LDQRKSLQDKKGILLAASAGFGRGPASARTPSREGLRLGQIFTGRQESLRVLGYARDPNLKMQVRAG
jgi:hypothetical protein